MVIASRKAKMMFGGLWFPRVSCLGNDGMVVGVYIEYALHRWGAELLSALSAWDTSNTAGIGSMIPR